MTKTFRTILRCAAGMLLCVHAFTATAQGYAVPIGGALKYDNDEVWSRLVQLAGGKGVRFAVFAMASATPQSARPRRLPIGPDATRLRRYRI